MTGITEYAKKQIIIAAHRGEAAGNVPPNTIASYEAAAGHGADMIEVDLNYSAEGTLWILHPGMERAHLGFEGSIRELQDEEIRALRYVNYDRDPTQFGLCTFDEVLTRFGHRCFINVDKFIDNPKAIARCIKDRGMQDRIVVKSAPRADLFDMMEEYAPDIAYLPILGNRDEGIHEHLLGRRMNYVGAEVCFTSEDSETGSPAYVERLHRDGRLVWVNSLIYNYKVQLAAGHSDDSACTLGPEYAWGWLADRGFDIIQTDRTLALVRFLEDTGRRFRT
ncbi:MAG: glycerophosphodiester phosphodiesterase family protein [Abditibacteriota bacterium]|nr:glycerophosphodiester phosphodiesterase family protein [Abditibacteriota bacterium]